MSAEGVSGWFGWKVVGDDMDDCGSVYSPADAEHGT